MPGPTLTIDRTLALIGVVGIGIAFMEPRAFWLGILICVCTGFYAGWMHRAQARSYFKKYYQHRRKARRTRPKFPVELKRAVFVVLFCLVSPIVVYATRAEPVLDYGTLSNSWYETLFSRFTHYPSIQIGEGGATVSFKGASTEPVFKFIEGSSLVVEQVRGRTKVSTQIKKQSDEVIADLRRNEWKVKPSLSFDRNYNDHSLEVIGPTGLVLLQVTVHPDLVVLQGEWHSKTDAVRLVVTKDPKTGKPNSMVLGRPQGFFPDDPEIKRMFKYPSDLHLGELVD